MTHINSLKIAVCLFLAASAVFGWIALWFHLNQRGWPFAVCFPVGVFVPFAVGVYLLLRVLS